MRGRLGAGEGLRGAERAAEEDAAGERDRTIAGDWVVVTDRDKEPLRCGEDDAAGEHELSMSEVTTMAPS